MQRTAIAGFVVVFAGCIAPEEDGRDDTFLTNGKTDVGGIDEGSPDARGVLDVANTVTEERLRGDAPDGVGLSERAVDNLIYVRLGDDGLAGTPDDGVLRTLRELDAVPFIGPVAFRKLLDYARANDFVKEPFAALTLGGKHSCAWSAKDVRCWGGNEFGQLGNGSRASATVPTRVSLGNNIKQVVNGTDHSCGLVPSTAGARLIAASPVRCWGLNDRGQLGDGTTTDREIPVSVEGMPDDIVQIAAGASHSCARTQDGGVWCWGANFAGQLGDGTTDGRLRAVPVRGLASGAMHLVLGGDHSCAVTDDAVLLCWGANRNGQLGDGTTTDRLQPVRIAGVSDVVAVDLGRDHSCAIERDSTTLCWGLNAHGMLGNGTKDDKTTPTPVIGLPGRVTTLSLGMEHTCARLHNATVACWGHNRNGRLGDGTTIDRALPTLVSELGDTVEIQAGYFHSCARRADAQVMCWGENVFGQLGDGTTTDRGRPTPLR